MHKLLGVLVRDAEDVDAAARDAEVALCDLVGTIGIDYMVFGGRWEGWLTSIGCQTDRYPYAVSFQYDPCGFIQALDKLLSFEEAERTRFIEELAERDLTAELSDPHSDLSAGRDPMAAFRLGRLAEMAGGKLTTSSYLVEVDTFDVVAKPASQIPPGSNAHLIIFDCHF